MTKQEEKGKSSPVTKTRPVDRYQHSPAEMRVPARSGGRGECSPILFTCGVRLFDNSAQPLPQAVLKLLRAHGAAAKRPLLPFHIQRREDDRAAFRVHTRIRDIRGTACLRNSAYEVRPAWWAPAVAWPVVLRTDVYPESCVRRGRLIVQGCRAGAAVGHQQEQCKSESHRVFGSKQLNRRNNLPTGIPW